MESDRRRAGVDLREDVARTLTEEWGYRLAAVAILAAGGVHLHLWLGNRSLHVVGPLFLLNAVVSVCVAAVLLGRPGVPAAICGITYSAATLAAFMISVHGGLFGFHAVLRGPAQGAAAAAELASIGLLILALWYGRRSDGPRQGS